MKAVIRPSHAAPSKGQEDGEGEGSVDGGESNKVYNVLTMIIVVKSAGDSGAEE